MLKQISTTVLDIIYPKNCIFCKNGIFDEKNNSYLCENCFENIEKNLPVFCFKCGRHLEETGIEDGICKQCRKINLYFDCAWSVCIFDGIVKDLIHKFKYSHKTVLVKVFAKLVCDFISNFNVPIWDYDIMLPVPLHPVRLREREYNQSQILAEELGKFLPLKILTKEVMRSRNTKSQILLDKSARWKNMKGAFRINTPEYFKNKNVLIIDDLLTTGATASELACMLKMARAHKVSVLTLAITK